MAVLFFRPNEAYGGFSNFSRHTVKVHGHAWPTSEHAFQAAKFLPHRPDLAVEVRLAKTPRDAANLGRDRSKPLREGWDKPPTSEALVAQLPDALDEGLQPIDGLPRPREPLFLRRLKDVVMYEVIYAKVTQNPDLRALLLGTGLDAIIEASPKDSYWGWGANRDGENKLGRIFMAVRSALVLGTATQTAFGKPACARFVCTPDHPWRHEYGPGEHPQATSMGGGGRFECSICEHQFE